LFEVLETIEQRSINATFIVLALNDRLQKFGSETVLKLDGLTTDHEDWVFKYIEHALVLVVLVHLKTEDPRRQGLHLVK